MRTICLNFNGINYFNEIFFKYHLMWIYYKTNLSLRSKMTSFSKNKIYSKLIKIYFQLL